MVDLPRISNWSIYSPPFRAPELGAHLKGTVTGHPTKPDGSHVRTSRIVATDEAARTVTTESGRVYALGEVDPNYAQWCADNGHGSPFPRIVGGVKHD